MAKKNVKEIIKTREGKVADRFYCHDLELAKSEFSIGSDYTYVIDVKARKVQILAPSKFGVAEKIAARLKKPLRFLKVSKKKYKDSYKKLIDVRDKEYAEAFKNCDYLQVSILEDSIVIQGFNKAEETIFDKAKNFIQDKIFKGTKIVDITQIMKVRKQCEVVLARSGKGVKKVAGLDYGFAEQLTIFDSLPGLSFDKFTKKDVKEAKKRVKCGIEAVSICCGAGLLDEGFKEDFDIIYAIDNDEQACKTYAHNHGDHIVCGDIRTADIPQTPVMIVTPPCTAFTNENRKEDKRNLGHPDSDIVFYAIDAIKKNKEGKIVVIENVPEFYTFENGLYKGILEDELGKLGYEISFEVLNAADYGSAQKRKRGIMLASKIGKILMPKSTHDFKHRTVGEVFEGLNDSIPNQLDRSTHKPATLECIKHVPPGGNIHDIPAEIRPSGKHSNMYRRPLLNGQAHTVVNFRKTVYLHPTENRGISVREACRLQDVPDTFVVLGDKLSDRQQQIANGVPVTLAKAISKTVRQFIDNFNATPDISYSFNNGSLVTV